jgi:hypothetical protein
MNVTPNLRFDTDRQQRRWAPLSPAGQAGRWAAHPSVVVNQPTAKGVA